MPQRGYLRPAQHTVTCGNVLAMTIPTWRSGRMTPVQQAANKLDKAEQRAKTARLQLIREVILADDGETAIADIATQANVARKTIYEWIARWTLEDVDRALGLAPQES